MSLDALADISRFYGKNPDYVLAGGGNTSWKDGEILYVKGSGLALADVVPESFVKIDRKTLAHIWKKEYPHSSAERESAVLADLMAARKPGEENKRPSVETLLHDIIPFAYVVHLHPALVNGMCCSQLGEQAMIELFGTAAIWIPSANPGYVLSCLVKEAMDAYHRQNGLPASIIFLQNHGVFAGADDVQGIRDLYYMIMSKIKTKIQPAALRSLRSLQSSHSLFCGEKENETMHILKALAGEAVFYCDTNIMALLENRSTFAPVSGAFTPDHIVYSGSEPLFLESQNESDIKNGWAEYINKNNRNPKIAAVQGLGIFGLGVSEKAAFQAVELFKDAVTIALYTASFGGPLCMSAEQVDFINNWEAERFRTKVSFERIGT